MRALTRAAKADNEADLLELARGTTTARLERMVRAWKKGTRSDEAEWERERHASRTFSVFPDDDGMYVVRGVLTPEVGALLMRAIDAAGDALFRARTPETAVSDTETDAARRRADAVGLLAERALAAGLHRARRNHPRRTVKMRRLRRARARRPPSRSAARARSGTWSCCTSIRRR